MQLQRKLKLVINPASCNISSNNIEDLLYIWIIDDLHDKRKFRDRNYYHYSIIFLEELESKINANTNNNNDKRNNNNNYDMQQSFIVLQKYMFTSICQ